MACVAANASPRARSRLATAATVARTEAFAPIMNAPAIFAAPRMPIRKLIGRIVACATVERGPGDPRSGATCSSTGRAEARRRGEFVSGAPAEHAVLDVADVADAGAFDRAQAVGGAAASVGAAGLLEQ